MRISCASFKRPSLSIYILINFVIFYLDKIVNKNNNNNKLNDGCSSIFQVANAQIPVHSDSMRRRERQKEPTHRRENTRRHQSAESEWR